MLLRTVSAIDEIEDHPCFYGSGEESDSDESQVAKKEERRRKMFNIFRMSRNLTPLRRGSVQSSNMSANTGEFENYNGTVEVEKYFGYDARSDFFDRFHWISKHRQIRCTSSEASITLSLDKKKKLADDYPFAPRRPDQIEFYSTGLGFPNELSELSASQIYDGDEYDPYENGEDNISIESSVVDSIFSSLPEVEGVQTPRSQYILNCIKDNLAPRPALVLRKNLTYELKLQHQAIGDTMGVIFAQSLKKLPFIEKINLCDNNLTDISLSKIIESIIELPNLKDLDLSRNKVDGNAAQSLASYLHLDECPIQRLILSHADIDDNECHQFISALKSNKMLHELDLSSNIIGKSENLNYVKPDVVTGGEAIGYLLSTNHCELRTLNIGWNMIRMEGATTLVTSLAHNIFLTHLDVSYNSLGKEGGEQLGKALLSNKTLKYINLTANGITSTGCFSICVAIEENNTLKSVILDDNPIGEIGAAIAMQIPVTCGDRVMFSCDKCNINIKEDCEKFIDMQDPIGYYVLDLELPYERAMCLKLLRIVADHPSLDFLSFDCESTVNNNHSPSQSPRRTMMAPTISKTKSIKLIQVQMNEKIDLLSKEERKVLAALRKLEKASKDVTLAKKLFNFYDADGSGSLDIEELKSLLRDLGVDVEASVVEQAMDVFDVDGAGTIELHEFIEFLETQHQSAQSRIQDLIFNPVMVDSLYPTQRYVPPESGIVSITIIDSFIKKNTFKVLSFSNYVNVVHVCKLNSENIAKKLTYSISNCLLRINEAQMIYEAINYDVNDRVKSLSLVLPHLADYTEARTLILNVIGNDDMAYMRLKVTLGNMLKVLLGMPNGYYTLDLSKVADRTCLSRLLALSVVQKKNRIEASDGKGYFGDISQMGNWSCFRNEFIDGVKSNINPKQFIPMPRTGKVSFDFAHANSCTPSCPTVSDNRCLNVLHNFSLVNKQEKIECAKILQKYRSETEISIQGNGSYVPFTTEKRAKAVGLCINKFYDRLPRRESEYRKAEKAEARKVDYSRKPNSTSYLNSSALLNNSNVESDSDSDNSMSDMHNMDNFVEDNVQQEISNNSKARMTLLPVIKKNAIDKKRVTLDKKDFVKVSKMALKSSNIVAELEQQEKEEEEIIKNTNKMLGVKSLIQNVASKNPILGTSSIKDDRKKGVSLTHSEKYIFDIGKKFRDMAVIKAVPDTIKASFMITSLENIFIRVWLKSRHLAIITEKFEVGKCFKTAHFGTYRVELIVSLYCRVVDIYNFDLVLRVLTPYELSAVYCRIGFLSLFNPLKPEGYHWLNLSRHEEREVVKILAALFTVEGSDSWVDKSFRWEITDDDIPGWSLLPTWINEEEMPWRGHLYLNFQTTNPDIPFRKSLLDMVAIEEYQLIADESGHHKMLVGNDNKQLHLDLWRSFLSPSTSTSAQIAAGNEPKIIEFNIVKKQAQLLQSMEKAKKTFDENDDDDSVSETGLAAILEENQKSKKVKNKNGKKSKSGKKSIGKKSKK